MQLRQPIHLVLTGIFMALPAHTGSAAAPAEETLQLHASAERVGRYEKIEFRLHTTGSYRDGCDAEKVKLTVRLDSPSGRKLEIPVFCEQKYERKRIERSGRKRDWLYPFGALLWSARFAPSEVGGYRAVARLEAASRKVSSSEVRFECVPSEHGGFLRVSPQDPRFFELSDGTPFFAIGQNLCYVGDQQYLDLTAAEKALEKLAANGANYVRVWTCCKDWALALEAEKSAWGRSWSRSTPVVPDPEKESPVTRCIRISGRDDSTLQVSPSHPVALRPDTIYTVSGRVRGDGKAGLSLEIGSTFTSTILEPGTSGTWIRFQEDFGTDAGTWWLGRTTLRLQGEGTAWLKDLSLTQGEPAPNLLWEADVSRPVRGSYNQLDSFLLDGIVEAAGRHGIYLQLCIVTRDLYMQSLKDPESPAYARAIEDARKLMRYAVARWGYSRSVATWEYFNEMDPGLPTERFYTEVGEHLERIDPYGHLRATSTWHPSEKDWRHPELDVADEHFYLRPVDKRPADEVEAVLSQARLLRQHAQNKPALLSEFGLATERWGLSPDMKRDADLVHFHNALWASALSGLSGTALFWWWDQLDRMDAYPHYRPLAAFLEDVVFTEGALKKTTASVTPAGPRVVGLQGKDRAFLWVYDPRAVWVGSVEKGVRPEPREGGTLEIQELARGTYRVQWWDTREGRPLLEESRHADAGLLRLPLPGFQRDVACKVLQSP